MDKCSRNTRKFLKLQDILFVALDLPTSVNLFTNKIMATTLLVMAEFKNNILKFIILIFILVFIIIFRFIRRFINFRFIFTTCKIITIPYLLIILY